jgi:hypothetical protein
MEKKMIWRFGGIVGMLWLFSFVVWMPVTGRAEQPDEQKGFGISISPSIIRLTAQPGESRETFVKVWNKSNAPMRFLLDLSDVGNRLAADGKLERLFIAPGTLPHSCAKWILLPETEFLLPPGEFRDVKVLISVPPDASGGKSGVVFFRGVQESPAGAETEDSQKTTTSVQIQPRLGVLIFTEIEGTVRRTGTLEAFEVLPPTADRPLTLQYVFKNAGNADILVEGSFYILDQNNALIAKQNLNAIRTFPGDEGGAETVWEGLLPPGSYRLVTSFELGPDTVEMIIQEAEFTVTG